GLLSAGRIRRVATAAPAAPRLDSARLDEHRNLGVAFYRTGMHAEAEREYRRVVALQPGDAEAHFRLGLIALRQARWGDARDAFEQSMTHGGRRVASLHDLALAHEALGDLDAAEAALAEASTLAPGDARLWIARGLLALRRNEVAAALDRFARARDALGSQQPPARWYWG